MAQICDGCPKSLEAAPSVLFEEEHALRGEGSCDPALEGEAMRIIAYGSGQWTPEVSAVVSPPLVRSWASGRLQKQKTKLFTTFIIDSL